MLSALFKRTVQNHTGCPERNLRCKCRYDRCEKLSSCGSVRLGVLYPCRREYGKKCENAAQKKSGIKGEGALNKLAALFEIEEEDMYVRAEKVADAVLADLYLPEYEKMKLVKKMDMRLVMKTGKNSASFRAEQNRKSVMELSNVQQT